MLAHVRDLAWRRYATLLAVGEDHGDDRGDVPGWVLITVMTAGLVTALWIVADDQLRSIFSSALNRVNGP
jgi:hypothetical protein